MENPANVTTPLTDDNAFSVKAFLFSCLGHWKWFVSALIIFIALGVLFLVRQQPKYSRTMQLLIQDSQSGGIADVSNAFRDFGLGGGANTNVYNELVSLKSPAVMQEVVKRLNLTVDVYEKKLPHNSVLYGKTSPFDLKNETPGTFGGIVLKLELLPDDSFVITEASAVPKGDTKRIKHPDLAIKGKIGASPVKTPVGTFSFASNGLYTNNRDEAQEYIVTIGSEHSAIEKYMNKLTGDLTDSDSEVIDLTMTDTNIERATDVLNTIVEVYNEFWVRDKNRMAVATSEFINDRLAMLVRELGEVDSDIAEYQSANHIPDLEASARMYLDQSASVSKGIIEANNQLAMVKYVKEYINNPANANKVVPVLTGVGNSGLEQLVKEYNTLLLTRDNLIQNSSPENPLVESYTLQANGMRESLIRSVNSYIGSLEANLRNLQSAQGQSMQELASTPSQAKYLGTVKRDQAIKEQLYLFLLQKREENDLSQAFNAYNTRIITPPFGSDMPVSPKKVSILAVAFILGLMIPAFIIYILDSLDNKVHSRKDLDNLPIPFTGELPQIGSKKRFRKLFQSKKAKQKEIDTPKPIVAEGKRDVPNEAFRVVRSNIDLMLGRNATHNVLMVTSFNPGSGKSFVAYNLGASFALKNKKVLLIDGDLRHGSLSGYIGSPGRGLASYLTGNTEDAMRIVYPVPGVEGLNIVPIGKRPPNPAELLEGDRFGEFLDAVRDQFDIIMVDCPPVNVVVDTQLLNRYADATLFVVRAGLLNRSAIKDLTQLYHEKKLRRMSIILNGTEEAHSSYYTYGNYQSLEE